jgi:ABC-type phosphate transport system substrate-binding protein
MTKCARLLRLAALLIAALLNVPASAEDVAVIVNKSNTNAVDHALVVKLYTGAARSWPDGSPVFVVDQAEDSPARAVFYAQVIGKSAATMKAIWAQNIFSGRGLPPKLANPDAEMKNLVSANKNAIGYISASTVDDSVRVIGR